MPTENCTKTAILTGTAIVTFRKRIEALDEQEAADLLADKDNQGFQIDEDDLLDIQEIHEVAVALEWRAPPTAAPAANELAAASACAASRRTRTRPRRAQTMSDKLREAFKSAADAAGIKDGQDRLALWAWWLKAWQAALAQQPAPVAAPSDFALRSRVADLLHLLQFAKIETPSHGDGAQTEVAMNDLERMLAAPAAPVAVGQGPVGFRDPSCAWSTVSAENKARALSGGPWQRSSVATFTVPLYAAPPASEQPDTVKVGRGLAERLCSRDNHTRQTARRELRNMLLAGGDKP